MVTKASLSRLQRLFMVKFTKIFIVAKVAKFLNCQVHKNSWLQGAHNSYVVKVRKTFCSHGNKDSWLIVIETYIEECVSF